MVEAKLAKNYGIIRMDPYCRIRVGNAVFETQVHAKGGKAPRWDYIMNAYLPHGVESIYLQIYDEVSLLLFAVLFWPCLALIILLVVFMAN